ncbi:hypothetical protein ES288_D11G101100v1 [Gossypium darwinii]|nr:hypothetical protein ES288_D11G101100v1 [Gossypium darwinii]
MNNKACSAFVLLICFLLIVSDTKWQDKREKPPKERNTKHDSNCCKEGKLYDICPHKMVQQGKKRCLKYINIHGNGKTVKAKAVNECDSTMGCDGGHSYQPPCVNNIIDDTVWEALGVTTDQRGGWTITGQMHD